MDRFKLVVFGDDWDVYQTAYRSLIENPHVNFISTYRPKGLLRVLQRIQFNPTLNRFLSIPFKSAWNPYYLKGITDKNLCFLIMENWLRIESGIKLLPFLRARYPEARIVCFTQDLIETITDQYTCQQIDVTYIKRYCDLWISYDTADAKKYDIAYHPTVYSPTDITRESNKPYSDLYFLGRDKGRMDLLVDICNTARAKGLVCNFLLLDVPQQRRVICEGIHYLDDTITYRENLQNCANSRCVIELLQHDAASPTFRLWECICLNKKLLTNNALTDRLDVYDSRYISIFQHADDIDWEFVNSTDPFPNRRNPYMDHIMPEVLVRFIEKRLNIKIELS